MVKICQFLRLSAKFLAVLRLSVNPIETLYLRLTVKIFQFLRLSTKFLTVLRLSVNPIKTLLEVSFPHTTRAVT